MAEGKALRIAIDGPSGAGKSTLARRLARHLGLPYLDTGAMYRAVGWAALQRDLSEASEVTAMLELFDLRVVADAEDFRVEVDGRDITAELRDPAVGSRASQVATIPEVRAWLVARQRAAAAGGGVLEGRDIGTVVLRDADLKLFVTATESVRMERRSAQLGDAEAHRAQSDIRDRDRRDSQRQASPLRAAEDAVVIDTSEETPDASLERILALVKEIPGAGSA